MKKAIHAVLLLGILFSITMANGQIAMQDWRIHFSVFSGQGIAETNDNIFLACSNGVIRYDLEDNSVNELTVTNGLSDLGITSIAADESTAIVGYVSGNLDVIEGNTITNVPWIEKAEISGDKTIHNFCFDENYIYVATVIGLILFDNDDELISLEASADTRAILLSGEPLNEPLATYGPFVMNNQTQVMEAIRDYQMGKMGVLIEEFE